MSGGGSQQQPVQTTTTQISPQAQQLFNLAYPGLEKFAATPLQQYGGSTVAGFTPTQEAGQQQLLQGAGTAGDIADWSRVGVAGIPGQLSEDVRGTTPYAPGAPLPLSSDIFNDQGIWNPQYNTGLSSAIEAAQRPTWQGLTEQALPAIRGTFGPGPQSTRQGIAEGLATSRANQQALDTAAKMAEDVYGQNLGAVGQRYGQNIGALGQRYGQDVGAETARYGTDIGAQGQRYGQNINAALAAYGLAPSLQQQALVPGATTSAVGEQQQAMNQAQLQDAISKFYFPQLAPFLQSQEIMSLVQGLPGATTISTGSVPQANPLTQALGGALAGGSLGATIGGPWGAAAGAGGGALLPFLFNR